jgi:fluoride exporter
MIWLSYFNHELQQWSSLEKHSRFVSDYSFGRINESFGKAISLVVVFCFSYFIKFRERTKLNNYFIVFLGGGIGSALRYWLSGVIPKFAGTAFPFGIFTINILGCFLIGFFMSALEERFLITPALRIFLTVGILGGFTTFSTFSYESISLLRDAEIFKAALYIVGSVLLCLFGTYVGSTIGKLI